MSSSVLILYASGQSVEQVKSSIAAVGLNSVVATSPESACQSIRVNRPDLILLDASLLLINFSLCRQLRSCCPEKRLPIILLIPRDSEEITRYLCGADVDDYICQPYSIVEFQTRLILRLSVAKVSTPRPMPQVDYALLNSLSDLVTSKISNTDISQRIVALVAEVIDVCRCSIILFSEDRDSAYVMASSDDLGVNGLRIDMGLYPEMQETLTTGRPLLIDDVAHHPLLDDVRPSLEGLGFNSILVLPMVDQEQTIGVLVLRTARSISGFSSEEISFCQLIASIASCALRLADVRSSETRVWNKSLQLSAQGHEYPDSGERSSLVNMAAHDLRVLVSVIDSYCMLLNETDSANLSPEQSGIVDGLMTGNRRLVDMTNDLLDFSRLDAGRFELALAEHDLCQIVSSVYSDLVPLINRRKIDFRIDCLEKKIAVVCDEHGIRRVFYNIVSNALKFVPDGGEISLELSKTASEIRVAVTDNGPGIKQEYIAGLFDEYVTASRTDLRVGNGLGLSICKKIIDEHQGRIWAESCLGQGSRFIFCLPQ